MSASHSNVPLPQGFSVFQPMLGAPLQFFPAMGTKQLDDLMDAYLPASISIKEKRATISLDFLDHLARTGETFKFYAVNSFIASPESPASNVASSQNVSPVTSNWDWSPVNGPTAQSTPSSSSRASRKATSPSSRHQTSADFSHIPGMKIMTKEGLDVTNSASRGSKTKEQRDHAHLMRIIKACDSCRKKKIRCDPSHKRRSAAQASPMAAAKSVKKTKATRTEKSVAPPAPTGIHTLPPPGPSIDLDFSFTSEIDELMPLAPQQEPWEELIQYPTDNVDPDYDFFFDPEGYLSSESAGLSTPDSQQSLSLSKSISPTSTIEHVVPGLDEPLTGTDCLESEWPKPTRTPVVPYLSTTVDASDYTDFNLYSPQSTFSEDEHMLTVSSSTPSTSSGEMLQENSQYVPGSLSPVHPPFGDQSSLEPLRDSHVPESWLRSNDQTGDTWSLLRTPLSLSGDTVSVVHEVYRTSGEDTTIASWSRNAVDLESLDRHRSNQYMAPVLHSPSPALVEALYSEVSVQERLPQDMDGTEAFANTYGTTQDEFAKNANERRPGEDQFTDNAMELRSGEDTTIATAGRVGHAVAYTGDQSITESSIRRTDVKWPMHTHMMTLVEGWHSTMVSLSSDPFRLMGAYLAVMMMNLAYAGSLSCVSMSLALVGVVAISVLGKSSLVSSWVDVWKQDQELQEPKSNPSGFMSTMRQGRTNNSALRLVSLRDSPLRQSMLQVF